MDHANNAVYLDWLEESLPSEATEDAAATPRRYRLEYALAAEAGAPLEASAWAGDAGWNVRLIHGATGADVFRARLEPGAGPEASEEER
jgi:acyl-ACP thioesterase-like protein